MCVFIPSMSVTQVDVGGRVGRHEKVGGREEGGRRGRRKRRGRRMATTQCVVCWVKDGH